VVGYRDPTQKKKKKKTSLGARAEEEGDVAASVASVVVAVERAAAASAPAFSGSSSSREVLRARPWELPCRSMRKIARPLAGRGTGGNTISRFPSFFFDFVVADKRQVKMKKSFNSLSFALHFHFFSSS